MNRPPHLLISIPGQTLSVLVDGEDARRCPISSSKFGPGFDEGSNRTPTGNVRITEKHGGDVPLCTAFKGRVPVGTCSTDASTTEDGILTRILRLDGCDPENRNSYERYIYIHGTNHEEDIGSPASIGCIRMKNEDVADLFDLVPVGTSVHIEGPSEA